MTSSDPAGNLPERRIVEDFATPVSEADAEQWYRAQKQAAEIASLQRDIAQKDAEIKQKGDEHEFRMTQQRDEHQFRLKQADRLMNVFYVLNGAVLGLVFLIWSTEHNAPPKDPIINSTIMAALIAASAAQLGTLVLAVGNSLFGPGRRPPAPQSPA